jgi:hypothetical protein
MIDGCDEAFSAYRPPEQRRSKKARKCDECRRDIAIGERYWSAAGLFEGHWDASVVCNHCHVACEWLKVNCGGWLFNGVFEDIEQHWDEYRRMDIARLVVGMKHKWRGPRGERGMPLPRLPRPLKLGDARG